MTILRECIPIRDVSMHHTRIAYIHGSRRLLSGKLTQTGLYAQKGEPRGPRKVGERKYVRFQPNSLARI